MAVKEILYATDYSEASKAALVVATSLARQSGATLLIVHVSDREQYPVGELFDENSQPDKEELSALKAVVPADSQVLFEHRLLYGEPCSTATVRPADEILKLAKEENVEAIVMGTHGRSELARLLMGNVAESVVRHALCRVITVSHPDIRWQVASVAALPL